VVIGARGLRLLALSNLLMPPSMVTEMLYQSTGHRLGAAVLSALRSGLFFIPLLLILAHFRGIAGIQEAQPLAHLLSAPIAIPFAMTFFRKMPKTDKDS
ncbi:MAG: MATE family efflux transporter, partial [Lachnospiraceae bacterium]|nr:MATE family efflux transporter [Lachnospiraceae bacterium]